jgi:hypothetical protein
MAVKHIYSPSLQQLKEEEVISYALSTVYPVIFPPNYFSLIIGYQHFKK